MLRCINTQVLQSIAGSKSAFDPMQTFNLVIVFVLGPPTPCRTPSASYSKSLFLLPTH